MYSYQNFIAYHPEHPERTISLPAMSRRGAAMKARNILCSMGLMKRTEKWDRVKVEGGNS